MASSIESKLTDVRMRIADAAERAGRAPDAITLVAVTKGRPVSDVLALHTLGVRHFGENRVPEAESKISALPEDIVWHMIGSIQRRKAAAAVRLFQRIDSVDRFDLAETLQRRAHDANSVLDVLVEVNVSGEASKHGINKNALSEMLLGMSRFSNLQVRGLMTMAPLTHDDSLIRRTFSELHTLAELNRLPVVSMGMTSDFEIAVEEGATEVRVGSALFD